MSDVAAVALITGLITGFVGLAGLAANIWNSQIDRELRLEELKTTHELRLEELKAEHDERYRNDLYAKRLEVHQQAFTWIQRLVETAKQSASPRPTTQLHEAIRPFMKSFDETMLYLDPVSVHEIAKITAAWHAWVEGGEYTELWAQFGAAQRAIVLGAGLKHFDWTEIDKRFSQILEDRDAS